jgi:hypothetical protein
MSPLASHWEQAAWAVAGKSPTKAAIGAALPTARTITVIHFLDMTSLLEALGTQRPKASSA